MQTKKNIAMPVEAWLVIVLVSVVVTLAGSLAPSPAQVTGAQFDSSRLERLRNLKFKASVPVIALKPGETQQVLEQDIKRDFSDERLRADGIAGSMLGLFPPNFDLKAEILRQAFSQFGGVYFDHLKEIILIGHGSDWNTAPINMSWLANYSGPLGNPLAHEVTHALQDQHFDLERRHERLKDESDQSTAFDSVIEGDATLAAVAYADDSADPAVFNRLVANLDGWTRRINGRAQEYKVAPGLADPGIFAHSEGIRFVASAYQRGGWEAVDALYRDPPISTQQIMNPQLYLEHKLPAKIQLAGYQKVMPAAVLVHSDTYGELLLQTILRMNLGDQSGQSSPAHQWAGDRIAILRQGDTITVVWMLVFTDPASAQQFAAYYGSILDRLHGERLAHSVTYRKNAVLCVAGEGLREHSDLPSTTWQETVISPGG